MHVGVVVIDDDDGLVLVSACSVISKALPHSHLHPPALSEVSGVGFVIRIRVSARGVRPCVLHVSVGGAALQDIRLP